MLCYSNGTDNHAFLYHHGPGVVTAARSWVEKLVGKKLQ